MAGALSSREGLEQAARGRVGPSSCGNGREPPCSPKLQACATCISPRSEIGGPAVPGSSRCGNGPLGVCTSAAAAAAALGRELSGIARGHTPGLGKVRWSACREGSTPRSGLPTAAPPPLLALKHPSWLGSGVTAAPGHGLAWPCWLASTAPAPATIDPPNPAASTAAVSALAAPTHAACLCRPTLARPPTSLPSAAAQPSARVWPSWSTGSDAPAAAALVPPAAPEPGG